MAVVRRLLLLGLAVVLAGAIAGGAPAVRRAPLTLQGTVTRALSGDLLEVRLPSGTQPVRIAGIVAPAARDCFATRAAARVREVAGGRRVALAVDRAAVPRGPLSARVTLPGGRDLGRLLVAGGFAQLESWSPEFARFAAYVPAEQAAQDTNRGLWGACSADLSVSVAGPEGVAVIGAPLAYTVTVENNGPLTARQISLELRPPASAELVSAESGSGRCAVAGWRAACSFASLRRGASVVSTFVLRTTRTGTTSVRASARFAWCARGGCRDMPLFDSNRRNDESAALTAVLASAPPPPPPGSPPPPPGAGGCSPAYPGICIPPPPPDLDCADIPYRDFAAPLNIPDADPHDFDGDEDGIGCQFNDY